MTRDGPGQVGTSVGPDPDLGSGSVGPGRAGLAVVGLGGTGLGAVGRGLAGMVRDGPGAVGQGAALSPVVEGAERGMEPEPGESR